MTFCHNQLGMATAAATKSSNSSRQASLLQFNPEEHHLDKGKHKENVLETEQERGVATERVT